MRWATLFLKIPGNWMSRIIEDHDVYVRVFDCMPFRNGGRGLLRISSNGISDAILDIVRNRKDVVKAYFSRISDRTVMGEVIIDKCAACRALNLSECFMVLSKSNNGWIEWTVTAESNSLIHDLIEKLKKNGCEVHIGKVSDSIGTVGLTQRQDEILWFAYTKGYYDYPKRIHIRDLSNIFEISSSTISEILRAGQRRIFSEYFGIPHQNG